MTAAQLPLDLTGQPGTGPPIRVVGLDLSYANTGICELDNTRPVGPRCWHVRTPAANGNHARQRVILMEVDRAVHDAAQRADVVAIEGLYVGQNNNTLQLAGLHEIVKYHLWRQGVPYVMIQPATRAVYATGNGRAGKDDVLLSVERRYGHLVTVKDNNQADALVLATMTLHHYGRALVAVPQTHARALASIKTWPDLTATESRPRPRTLPTPVTPGGGGTPQRSMP